MKFILKLTKKDRINRNHLHRNYEGDFMGNANVIYIDYLDSYLDILNSKFPKWFRKFVYKILNYCGYIKKKNNFLTLICVENENINKRMINNLIKKIEKYNINNIVLAEKLLKNSDFVFLFENKFNILDGKWLYKFLIFNIVQKIAIIQNKKINEYEITILCNNPNEIVYENIKKLSKSCKVLNILTKNSERFISIENILYENSSLLVNVSTNKKKVCLFSNIVINIDFSRSELEECNLKRDSILIQCTKEKTDKKLKAVITFYRLSFDKSYMSFFNRNKNFEEEILYESLFYGAISLDGMEKFLVRDNVKIKNFEGLHGKIKFRELVT